jgi:dienelactone hydrolase
LRGLVGLAGGGSLGGDIGLPTGWTPRIRRTPSPPSPTIERTTSGKSRESRGVRGSYGESGGVDWQVEIYGGVGHSSTNPRVSELGMPGFEFNAAADRRSWRSMRNLLEERLRPD